MPTSYILPASSSRKHDARTLNAHLARTSHINDENTPPISPYTQYSSSSHLPIPSSPKTPPLSPPNEFTTPISPPLPKYPRLESHTPRLDELDKAYRESEHTILDGRRMVGAGGVGNPWNEDKREKREGVEGKVDMDVDDAVMEMRAKDAIRVLENHIRDRMPFAQVASRRMQAVMGIKNEIVFDLPEVRRASGFGHYHGTESNGLDAGHAARAAARSYQLPPERRRDSGLAFGFSNPHSPLNSPQVDPETGKGLREWLLSKGKEFGMRKKECRSISFHDFTPDMRNNTWSNKLLGHFAVGEGREGRERVDYYEVDLPTTTIDPSTGKPTPTTETWLWFLISRPVLTIDPQDTSTRPTSQDENKNPSSIQSTPKSYYTPATRPSSSPIPWPDSNPIPTNPTPPPNFACPIPTSWLVIACPLSNTTSYPESIENLSDPTIHHSRSKRRFPFSNLNTKGGKKVYKRKDFDLSQNGLPIVEFNSSTLFTGNQPSFLGVDGIGGWFEGDEYGELPEGEFRALGEKFAEDGNGEAKKATPSPYAGKWWTEFYKRVGEDAERWEQVKGAMGRGKCRVVVRWCEWAEPEESEDVEMGDGLQDINGEGFPGSSVGGGMGVGGGKGKIRERIVGRQRSTRSETRRRSGLGIGESVSGVAIGIGAGVFGESSRSRGVGNKDLGKEKKRGGKK